MSDILPLTRHQIFDILYAEFGFRNTILYTNNSFRYCFTNIEECYRKASIQSVKETEYWFHHQDELIQSLRYVNIKDIK